MVYIFSVFISFIIQRMIIDLKKLKSNSKTANLFNDCVYFVFVSFFNTISCPKGEIEKCFATTVAEVFRGKRNLDVSKIQNVLCYFFEVSSEFHYWLLNYENIFFRN